MRKFGWKRHSKASTGKVIAAALVGSAIGAVVGLLMAPASGQEIRRKITGGIMDARERAKSAAGNIESRARELAEEVSEDLHQTAGTVSRGRRAVSTSR